MWIMITLAKALLLHNERVFHQASCLLSRAFESHNRAIFQNQLLYKLSARQAAEKNNNKQTTKRQDRLSELHQYKQTCRKWESVNTQESSLVFVVFLALLLKHAIGLRGENTFFHLFYKQSPFKAPFHHKQSQLALKEIHPRWSQISPIPTEVRKKLLKEWRHLEQWRASRLNGAMAKHQ